MDKHTKCLIIYPDSASFVSHDINILKREYETDVYHFKSKKGIGIFIQLADQFFFLVRKIRGYRFVYVAFAQYHSILPVLICKLFRKRCYIMVGGTDAHCFPEIGYGNHSRPFLKVATCFSLRYCYKILPKHGSLVSSQYSYFKAKYPLQGYANLCRNEKLKFKSIVIENGYDVTFWHPSGQERNKWILTVGSNLQRQREFLLKGIDLLLEVADKFSDYTFVIIGASELPANNIPKNILLIPHVPYQKLRDYYSKADIYLQLSVAEGFPNALCEAILCGCIPIGSNVFGIPDIIGDERFILYKKDKNALAEIIQFALREKNEALRDYFRNRIKDLYPLNRRATLLLNALA
ncbi:MAG: glycosyltransferase family 4 protein [Chitinophagales bacterium]|nr:glycosyltransferase family 4 protein [Chitinophagales bacterium]MDW8273790.1 glycosyltransferase family 4 protein [Chitinophagales bacterium]